MNEKENESPFNEAEYVASAMECTGLMPALPQTEEQDENYAALYSTHTGHKNCKLYRRK